MLTSQTGHRLKRLEIRHHCSCRSSSSLGWKLNFDRTGHPGGKGGEVQYFLVID